jgi:hypothetical protein
MLDLVETNEEKRIIVGKMEQEYFRILLTHTTRKNVRCVVVNTICTYITKITTEKTILLRTYRYYVLNVTVSIMRTGALRQEDF